MKKLLYLLFFASTIRADEKPDKPVDLLAIVWATTRLEETTKFIYSDTKSEKCKKNIENMEKYKQESDKKRDYINSFNPKSPPNSKSTWAKEKSENPFITGVVEKRHKTGEPFTPMEMHIETYQFAALAPELIHQINSINKHFSPEDQLDLEEYLVNLTFPHEYESTNKNLDAQIELLNKTKEALVKVKKKQEEEKKENQDAKTMQSNLIWALHHPEHMKRFRKFYVEEAKERQQRQASDK